MLSWATPTPLPRCEKALCPTLKYVRRSQLKRIETHWNTLKHIETHQNTLKHIETHWNTPGGLHRGRVEEKRDADSNGNNTDQVNIGLFKDIISVILIFIVINPNFIFDRKHLGAVPSYWECFSTFCQQVESQSFHFFGHFHFLPALFTFTFLRSLSRFVSRLNFKIFTSTICLLFTFMYTGNLNKEEGFLSFLFHTLFPFDWTLLTDFSLFLELNSFTF